MELLRVILDPRVASSTSENVSMIVFYKQNHL